MNREFLKEWFGIYAGRELGDPQRFFADRYEDLLDFVEKCKVEKKPCYMSVQPYSDRDCVYGLEKLFFDFDSKEDTSKAWKEAETFAEKLIEYYRVLPFITFSGGKGYHVYVFLKNTVAFPNHRAELVKKVYELLQRKLLKGFKFETLDQSVIGDLKRLARVPYSMHEKTGKRCYPITLSHQFFDPESLEIYRVYGLDTYLIREVIRDITNKEKIHNVKRSRSKKYVSNSKVRPCILEALKQPLEGEEGHLMRLAIAREYLNLGYSVDEVAQLFKTQSDYGDGRKSRYYVEYLKRHPSKPVKCKTIQELGFCLGDSCKIYRRSNPLRSKSRMRGKA